DDPLLAQSHPISTATRWQISTTGVSAHSAPRGGGRVYTYWRCVNPIAPQAGRRTFGRRPLQRDSELVDPGESHIGVAARLVLGANPARIGERLGRFEYGRVGDLALVGLGAGRNSSDLDMTDERKIPLELSDDISLSGADVIDVE